MASEDHTRGSPIVAGAGKSQHYKELLVWKRSMELAKNIYVLTVNYPSTEVYGLVSHMRRAAVSIPSNIAEGQARHGTREFLQFLSHASGSLAELETQLILSVDLGFCSATEADRLGRDIADLQKMLAAIRKKLSGSSQPLITRH